MNPSFMTGEVMNDTNRYDSIKYVIPVWEFEIIGHYNIIILGSCEFHQGATYVKSKFEDFVVDM